MKLPIDAEIPLSKIRDYLLVPRARSDKSKWLNLAGYSRDDPFSLINDIRSQLLPLDAVPNRSTEFGETYEIRGILRGPDSCGIWVRTIWLKDPLSGRYRFVTLIPLPNSRRI